MQTNVIIGTGLVAGVGAALAVIVRTKWLQSRTLPKCVLLSVALHAVVAGACACLVQWSPASSGQQESGRPTMLVVVSTDDAGALPADAAAESPAEPSLDPLPAAVVPAADLLASDPAAPTAPPPGPPADHVPLLAVADEPPMPKEMQESQRSPESQQTPPTALEASAVTAAAGSPPPAPAESDAPPALPAETAAATPPTLPAVYADRAAGRRAAAAAARGGSLETERAVQAALAWLAAQQSGDGRWNAARHGGGVERSVPGHHRHGVGAQSDHGVSGLAMLAFLGAGSTHQGGPHADTVARGLRFLVGRQRDDGSLAGDAEFFAALYCHGMAGLAVAECAAMTGDAALRPPLEKAVRYTLAMQSPATGGWRYAAGDKGDTSQLGWQVMLLASARQAGITGLEAAEAKAGGFLRSVSSGRAGGLAAYRAGERPSVPMTAEALASRLFLGMPVDHSCVAEAVELLARSRPESRSPNVYAWYYATLASFHVGGPQWDAWNRQLQAAILPSQRRDSGDLDGSWDPDPVWGGHGGRVYSTAMAALTLEVYYRYLPLHRQAGPIATVGNTPAR